MEDQFLNNEAQRRLEYHIDGAIVFANYHKKDGVLFIDYVEAPPQLRGSGAAGKLMRFVMQHAREKSLKITPICSFALSWMKRHPEYQDLLV